MLSSAHRPMTIRTVRVPVIPQHDELEKLKSTFAQTGTRLTQTAHRFDPYVVIRWWHSVQLIFAKVEHGPDVRTLAPCSATTKTKVHRARSMISPDYSARSAVCYIDGEIRSVVFTKARSSAPEKRAGHCA